MKTNKPHQAERGENKHRDKGRNGKRSVYGRSRVSAGLTLLPTVDGRSAHARTFKDTYRTLLNHVGGDDAPEPLRLECRRASALESELVNLEVRFARLHESGEEPKPADLDLHSRLTNTQRRSLEVLGWQRHMRDVTPINLDEYLANKVDA